eukprot:Nk52_evm2s326 gene=Nk52_evmTU2s326
MGDLPFIKGQDYKSLYKELQQTPGKLFEDPYFQANDKSLWGDGPARINSPVVWVRPQELVKHPFLMKEKKNPDHIVQGRVGNCWFVAACNTLRENAKLFERVVPDYKDQQWFMKPKKDKEPEKNPKYCGLFKFVFWRFGDWYEVVVDDRLPCIKSGTKLCLVYAHCNEGEEFWASLVEKAYAKVNGCYQSLESGNTADALVDFTSGVSESIDLKESYAPRSNEKPEERNTKLKNFHEDLIKASDRMAMISCSINTGSGQAFEAKTPQGLVVGHAYSVTAVKKIKSGITGPSHRLLRLRNPWGKFSWNGAWSDQAPEWKKFGKKDLKKLGIDPDEDDGEFYMCLEDVIKHFDSFIVCRIVNTRILSLQKTWRLKHAKGGWRARVNAGGCVNHPSYLSNPQYIIEVNSESQVMASLMQQDVRQLKQQGVKNMTIGFGVHRVEYNRDARISKDVPERAGGVTYINSHEVMGKFVLEQGRYVIIPSTFDPNEQQDYLLRVYSESDSHMRLLKPYVPKKTFWLRRKPKGMLHFTVMRCEGLPNQDVIGTGADAYAYCKFEGRTFKTPPCKDTLSPSWKGGFVTHVRKPKKSKLKIQIWNSNLVKDAFLGETEIDIPSYTVAAKEGKTWVLSGSLRPRKGDKKPVKGAVAIQIKFDNGYSNY